MSRPRFLPRTPMVLALINVLLFAFNERLGATFRSSASNGTPYECPRCHWREYTLLRRPLCSGSKGRPHEEIAAERVDVRGELQRSGVPKRFY